MQNLRTRVRWSKGFTPLHPESLGLQTETEDEGKIRIRSSGKAPSFRTGVTGFTLVEVLVSVALFIIIIAIVFTSFNTANSLGFLGTSLVDLQQQTRQAVDGMSREIRQSRVADINITEEGAKINFFIGGNEISYYVNDDNRLIREYPAETTMIMANKITLLNFSLVDKSVLIKVKATTSCQGRDFFSYLVEKVWLRN